MALFRLELPLKNFYYDVYARTVRSRRNLLRSCLCNQLLADGARQRIGTPAKAASSDRKQLKAEQVL